VTASDLGHTPHHNLVFPGMKLLIVGATGNTGREVLDLGLARQHQVTAFVRSPAKISRTDATLRVVRGDPFDLPALATALQGQDAVISTLGLPPRQALRPSNFMAESTAAIVSAMRTADVSRLCILSAAVLFPGRGLQYAFFKWLLQHHARDLDALETVVKASDLEWTIARPPRLVKAPDARYLAARDALPDAAFSATFRGVAAFLLDAAESHDYQRATVGVVSPRLKAMPTAVAAKKTTTPNEPLPSATTLGPGQ
jgi:putative NADH-flavin reductase